MTKYKNETLWLILAIFAASLIVLLFERWQTGTWNIPAFVITAIIIVIIILVSFFRKYRRQILGKLGIEKNYLITIARFAIAGVLATLFALYILIPNPNVSIPAGLQFNVIVISATLGGLVLAGASNRRISRKTNNQLISVAKRFIYATILFLVFTVILFWIESTGGIDVNIRDFSRDGIIRGILFYSGAASFYAGIFLFSIAIIDLALTLRDVRGKTRRGG